MCTGSTLLNTRFMNRVNPQGQLLSTGCSNHQVRSSYSLRHVQLHPPFQSAPGPRHHHSPNSYRESRWYEPKGKRDESVRAGAARLSPPPLLFPSHFSPPDFKATKLTLRTPNSPRTTRLRISSTAWAAAIFEPST